MSTEKKYNDDFRKNLLTNNQRCCIKDVFEAERDGSLRLELLDRNYEQRRNENEADDNSCNPGYPNGRLS